MTTSQIVATSGLNITKQQKSKLGYAFRAKAGELKVPFTKVDEIVQVIY